MAKSKQGFLTTFALKFVQEALQEALRAQRSARFRESARLDKLQREEERRLALEEEERLKIIRDLDVQPSPYSYRIGVHGNESLAIRYGIANQERKVREYWYHEPGGERVRNPDRDSSYYEPAGTIRLQKVRKISEARYEVQLSDFRDRLAIAVIEPGTEVVKTFLPLDESWFSINADLELTLKGNGTFSLKELARIHVDKAMGRKG